ncbi:hypothetical protein QO004_004614 [Rhizobium mesoamericanum]|nr:hypothetical protein [Rhizobium mesoamericanum]
MSCPGYCIARETTDTARLCASHVIRGGAGCQTVKILHLRVEAGRKVQAGVAAMVRADIATPIF